MTKPESVHWFLGTSHALGEEPILSAGHWKMVWNFRFQMWRCWKILHVWQIILDMYVSYIICALAISPKDRIVRWMHEICMTWWNSNEWYWMAWTHIDARHEVEATRASWIIESGTRPWRRPWTSWMWSRPSWQAGESRWFLGLITLRESCQRERPTGVRWCNCLDMTTAFPRVSFNIRRELIIDCAESISKSRFPIMNLPCGRMASDDSTCAIHRPFPCQPTFGGHTARLLCWWSSGDGDRSKVWHDTERRDELLGEGVSLVEHSLQGGGLIRIG